MRPRVCVCVDIVPISIEAQARQHASVCVYISICERVCVCVCIYVCPVAKLISRMCARRARARSIPKIVSACRAAACLASRNCGAIHMHTHWGSAVPLHSIHFGCCSLGCTAHIVTSFTAVRCAHVRTRDAIIACVFVCVCVCAHARMLQLSSVRFARMPLEDYATHTCIPGGSPHTHTQSRALVLNYIILRKRGGE